jgi:hypothetical protein
VRLRSVSPYLVYAGRLVERVNHVTAFAAECLVSEHVAANSCVAVAFDL